MRSTLPWVRMTLANPRSRSWCRGATAACRDRNNVGRNSDVLAATSCAGTTSRSPASIGSKQRAVRFGLGKAGSCLDPDSSTEEILWAPLPRLACCARNPGLGCATPSASKSSRGIVCLRSVLSIDFPGFIDSDGKCWRTRGAVPTSFVPTRRSTRAGGNAGFEFTSDAPAA